jgi:DNA-binding NarL/FixJ family response regulator
MPGRTGLDILPEVRAQAPDVKVLVLTGRDEDAYIVRALRAGAHGYVLKSANEDEMIDAIAKVTQGQLVLGRGVAEKIVGGMLSPSVPDEEKLTEIDQAILLHVAAGYDNEEIAQRLDIPLTELIEMLARIMDLTNARDRNAAALTALRTGQILLDDLHDLTRSR